MSRSTWDGAGPGNSECRGSFQPIGRKGQRHVAARVVSLTTYIYSSGIRGPRRVDSPFLDTAGAPRHNQPRFGAGLGLGLSPRASTHQHRLQEAGPENIRAPGSNTEKKMFAVFKTGGKQYRVAAEDVLKVDKVKGEPGEIVEFGEVLVVGADSVTLSPPTTKTSPNSTISPGSPLILSTWSTSSAATRYCLPPVLKTANIFFSVFDPGARIISGPASCSR